MNKVELLAPAGSFEALVAAVQNGCDAIYLGGAKFGARAYATNFDGEEMLSAIRYAHRFGVKVYVTLNILIYEDEVEECMEYVDFLFHGDVDALIIQDIGMLDLIHQSYPDLELHSSTQMHVHNEAGVSFMKSIGVSRSVVARECSIEEIKSLSKSGVDIEVFVYGALCISYSGQCLMSSILKKRSGNRGECSQSCRMRYELFEKKKDKDIKINTIGDYLLSPKDLNTLEHVPELIEAGIHSFKIEGRMKRPEYVAFITALYRQAIDAYYEHKRFILDEEKLQNLKKLFHRGFTKGPLFNQKGSNLMNVVRPNHIGVEIGKVIRVNKDKITIKLSDDLAQGDGVRFLQSKEDEGFSLNRLYKNDLLVNQAFKGDIVEFDNKSYVEKDAILIKTTDKHFMHSVKQSYEQVIRRVPIHMHFIAHLNQRMELMVEDDEGFQLTCHSDMLLEKANQSVTAQERIQQQLYKVKDTCFEIASFDIELDDQLFIPIKELNQLRRDALHKLEELREKRYVRSKKQAYQRSVDVTEEDAILSVLVHTKEQYLTCVNKDIKRIYIADKRLFEEVKEDANVIEMKERVHKGDYHTQVMLASEVGDIPYADKGSISNDGIHCTNSYSLAFLLQYPFKRITISKECSEIQITQMLAAFEKRYGQKASIEWVAYGRVEMMLSDYCVINASLADNDKKNCQICRNTSYYLKDQMGRSFPLLQDESCRMHILQDQPQYHQIPSSLIHSDIRLEFTVESKHECEKLIEHYQLEMEELSI